MLAQSSNFYSRALCEEKTWRVLTAISALPDRNTCAGAKKGGTGPDVTTQNQNPKKDTNEQTNENI
jgi:hypothetical protein